MARGIELDEVEAATGIRVRFLVAIEEEEWERLPGEFYARAFTRTYASYLGLDPAEFVPDGRPGLAGAEEDGPRVEPQLVPDVPSARQPRRWLPAAAALAAIVAVAAAAVLLVASLGDDGTTRSATPQPATGGKGGGAKKRKSEPAEPAKTSLRISATAEVWVCLLNGKEEPLVDGQILQPGEEVGPFRSKRYLMSFGNGGVELMIDGDVAETPESSSPVGYRLREGGELEELPEGERPECA